MTVGPQQSLVIFDLDNTLVDRDRFFVEWTGALIRERHLDGEVSLAILRDADEDGVAPRTLFFERVQARLGLRGPIEDLIDEYWRDQMARYRCDQETIAGLRLLGSSVTSWASRPMAARGKSTRSRHTDSTVWSMPSAYPAWWGMRNWTRVSSRPWRNEPSLAGRRLGRG